MKVDEIERQDRYGEYPVCWVSGKDATPQNIYEWLWSHGFNGYKFAIVIDCMTDEFQTAEKETPVYTLDSIANELFEYIGADAVERWLNEKKSKS